MVPLAMPMVRVLRAMEQVIVLLLILMVRVLQVMCWVMVLLAMSMLRVLQALSRATARPLFLTDNLARGLAQGRGCTNLLFHAVCARPRASLHVLQSSSNVSQRVGLSLFLQHTALGDQLRQFSLETSLKWPLLR